MAIRRGFGRDLGGNGAARARADVKLRRRDSHGFSLVELVVVIVILAILSSLLLSGLAGARQRDDGAFQSVNRNGSGDGIIDG